MATWVPDPASTPPPLHLRTIHLSCVLAIAPAYRTRRICQEPACTYIVDQGSAVKRVATHNASNGQGQHRAVRTPSCEQAQAK